MAVHPARHHAHDRTRVVQPQVDPMRIKVLVGFAQVQRTDAVGAVNKHILGRADRASRRARQQSRGRGEQRGEVRRQRDGRRGVRQLGPVTRSNHEVKLRRCDRPGVEHREARCAHARRCGRYQPRCAAARVVA
eukprot:320427-Chlamydomonas_euryale.AAC.4